MPTLIGRRAGSDDVEVARQTVGNALVVHRAGRMTDSAKALALAVAEDTEHDLVVVDLPVDLPMSVWDAVVNALPRKRRGVRLVLGGRSREATALAGQLLAERLNRPVIAPDGAVVLGAGGSLFVHSGRGSGWYRLAGGRLPRWEAKRFPKPGWESDVTAEIAQTSSQAVVEPLPAGVWLRPVGFERQQRRHRIPLVEQLPLQQDVLTVVLGSPASPPVSVDDAARLWMRLSAEQRQQVRFVQYGPVAVAPDVAPGQALADLVGEEVSFYTGLPTLDGHTTVIRSLGTDGRPGWLPFARELTYRPGAAGSPAPQPLVRGARPPVPGLPEMIPGVYWFSPDVVVEVVPSGLLLRPPQGSPFDRAVRNVPMVPGLNHVVFDAAGSVPPARISALAKDLLAGLEPATRNRSRLVSAESLAGERAGMRAPGRTATIDSPAEGLALLAEQPTQSVVLPPAAEPALPQSETIRLESGVVCAPDARRTPQPVAAQPVAAQATAPVVTPDASVAPVVAPPVAPPVAVPVAPPVAPPAVPPPAVPDVPPPPALAADPPAVAPAPAPPAGEATRVQPTPQPEASAVIGSGALDNERAWLRKAFGAEFGTMANAVARVLSEHPGLQGAKNGSSADLLTEAVAVRAYLSEQGVAVDAALRSAAVGAHVPFARCVAAGLRQLPAHRGATTFAASPTPQQWALYRKHALVTEWGFLNAMTTRYADVPGDTDVVMWSMTARRTRLLEPRDGVEDRVLFVPGTSFKVLELAPPDGEGRGRILLRELTAAEVDDNGRVDPGRASLDELALTSLHRELEAWAGTEPTRRAGAAVARFRALPGLV